jgi:formylglycine-generating enzyme required for sulfatase activity
MVLVEEGKTTVGSEGSVIPAFLIDQHEVTNEEFLKFVSAGGYRDRSLWGDTPWDSVLHAFVDRTGVPGPRFWSGGTYPAEKKDHPVVGITWYEASAYARWAGKELPSSSQWWRAALGDAGAPFPWGRDAKTAELRANFELAGTRPVGSYPLGVSPFGCLDMAGNVREWLREAGPDPARRVVVGGSWQDPVYMFEPGHAEWFDPAFSNEAIGFRCVKPLEAQHTRQEERV